MGFKKLPLTLTLIFSSSCNSPCRGRKMHSAGRRWKSFGSRCGSCDPSLKTGNHSFPAKWVEKNCPCAGTLNGGFPGHPKVRAWEFLGGYSESSSCLSIFSARLDEVVKGGGEKVQRVFWPALRGRALSSVSGWYSRSEPSIGTCLVCLLYPLVQSWDKLEVREGGVCGD